MLNNTEVKGQNANSCSSENNGQKGNSAKTAERRLHRKFRQHRSASQAGSGWRVTMW